MARRVSGVPWHGAGRFCFIPLDGEVVRLSCEDCLEVFLVAADALGMGLGERDDIYYRLFDRRDDHSGSGTSLGAREAKAVSAKRAGGCQ